MISYLQVIHLTSFLIYIFFIGYVLMLKAKPILKWSCILLLSCLSSWSLGKFMVHNPNTPKSIADIFIYFNVIGGWCIHGIYMFFIFTYTEKSHILRKKYIYPLIIFIPACLLIIQATTGSILHYVMQPYGWGLKWDNPAGSLLFFSYVFISETITMFFLYRYGKTTKNKVRKKQVNLLFYGSLISFILSYTTNIITPIFHLNNVPDLANVLIVIWIWCLIYAVKKYNFMQLNPSIAAEYILNTMDDALLLVDPELYIMATNPSVVEILGLDKKTLLGRKITDFFTAKDLFKDIETNQSQNEMPMRNYELEFNAQSGKKILSLSMSAVMESNNMFIGYVVIIRDITNQKEYQKALEYAATHDHLTNLPNRYMLNHHLAVTLNRAERLKHMVGIALLDIDRFKEINDTKGHSVGDKILLEVSRRLLTTMRKNDIVARVGGDEFIVVISDCQSKADIENAAARMLEVFNTPAVIDTHELYIKPSIGLTVFPLDSTNMETLFKNADMAMYISKRVGGNSYSFYSPVMGEKADERANIINNIYRALDNNEFLLYYQPQYDVDSSSIVAVEALLRLKHPILGVIGPLKIIPIAEETGLIYEIGEWVLRTACAQCKTWQDKDGFKLPVAVNLSARQLIKADIADTIFSILDETGLDYRYLIIEITETAALADEKIAAETLRRLNEKGVRIHMDDFGSGYSSLALLKKFPISAIKIDSQFVRNIAINKNDEVIVKVIVAMAHILNIEVIVEGVETFEQLHILKTAYWNFDWNLKCDKIQGYYFSKPLPPEELNKLLKKNSTDNYKLA